MGLWASVSDAIGLSSLQAAPVLPWLFTCTVVMQVLATFVSLAFTNYLVIGYVCLCSLWCTWHPVHASLRRSCCAQGDREPRVCAGTP